MPSRPPRLTSLSHPDAVHVLNQNLDEYAKRIDDIQKLVTPRRIASQSLLVFGTVGANSCVEATVNILGATTKLVAHANPTLPLGSTNLSWTAYVSAANQVKVRVCNPTGAGIAVNTIRWNILVL